MATKPNRKAIRRPPSALPWVIGAVAVVAIVYVLMISGGPKKGIHPEPRADAASMGGSVMPASFFARDPHVEHVYQLAKENSGTLDGIYCHCDCSIHSGHRSLLAC